MMNNENNKKIIEVKKILHELTWDDYFMVKCLLKSNVARGILLTNYIERS